jgi:hypothetical protein
VPEGGKEAAGKEKEHFCDREKLKFKWLRRINRQGEQ